MFNLDPQTSQIILFLIIFLFFIWNLIITIVFLKISKTFNTLTHNVDKKDLFKVLKELLKNQSQQSSLSQKSLQEIENLKKLNQLNLQKIGFHRFNPFQDTGGDQSFVLALLDNLKNGIILTCLHSRDTTRVYTKLVQNGQSQEIPLSEEEKKVLDKIK